MTTWLLIVFLSFLCVALLTGVLIPQILLIAFRKDLYDIPDERKIHTAPIPRLGGIAFFPAILFTLILAFGIFLKYSPGIMADVSEKSAISLCFLTCSVVILYLVGIADDLIGLKYRAKFIIQVIAAALVVAGGLQLDNLHGFLFVHEMPLSISVFLTILLTVFITNAINLIDGIDGLASGLSAVVCGFYGVVFFNADYHIYTMIAFCTLGALVPFFYYNVFGDVTKHGKIFMGDTGALTIGFLLSVMSIRMCNIPDETLKDANPAVVAFAPLLIPCCDVVRVYLHRLRAHRSPFLPDKTHIHHKLIALGMSPRKAMPTIISASILVTLANYVLSSYVNITILFCLDVVLWTVANLALSRAIRIREKRLNKVLYS